MSDVKIISQVKLKCEIKQRCEVKRTVKLIRYYVIGSYSHVSLRRRRKMRHYYLGSYELGRSMKMSILSVVYRSILNESNVWIYYYIELRSVFW